MCPMHSSSTTTTTYVQDTNTKNDTNTNSSTIVRILKLAPQKVVRWDENTIDNENAQKKSSKVCCIYHRPKNFGESSDSESDLDSDVEQPDNQKKCNSSCKKDNPNSDKNEELELKK
ncbi:protein phosphatase inhibitor 3 [Plasmodium sp. gorilla clade G3]|nr:protein phosphatase inhibitor 3 [Plasmodium sp. gorilla clade G3]